MYSGILSSSRTLLRIIKPAQNANQVRLFAARRGKREKMLAAKREKKLAQGNAPTTPKYLPRVKKQASEKDCHRVTDENWLQASITDDIWRLKFCRGKPYSVRDAVTMLQELHHPTMLNEPNAFIYATIELDLRMKKKNHFVDEFTGTIIYPHDFETGTRNRVVALSENSEDQFKASEAGAAYVGGLSLIKRIEKGELKTSDDFDYVICHLDMLKEVNKLRGLLKKKFPSIKNRLLTTCLEKTVADFHKCTEYYSNSSTLEPDFGWIDVCFGRLNMTPERLEDNLKELLITVEANHKPTGAENLFITRTLLWCSKSSEKFKIPHWEYLPGYPLNGVFQDEDSAADGEEAEGKI